MIVLAVAVVVLVSLVLWAQHRAEQTTPGALSIPASIPSSPMSSGTNHYDVARAKLAELPIKGWDRAQDFNRYFFGKAWSDDVNVEFGHNGCNTRDDILRRDLTDLVVRQGTCFAQSGILRDPYTGAIIDFVRGPETSNSVEIDHVVSLADAWYKGARSWDPQRRLDFANDPRNLLAVSPKTNFNKAFRDAASWLPPNVEFRCDFVARQVEVKSVYGLWVSAKEGQAMADLLAGC